LGKKCFKSGLRFLLLQHQTPEISNPVAGLLYTKKKLEPGATSKWREHKYAACGVNTNKGGSLRGQLSFSRPATGACRDLAPPQA
jgi:hypothetical protein